MSDSTTFIVNNRQELSTNIKIRRFELKKEFLFCFVFLFFKQKNIRFFFFFFREKTRSLLVNVFRTRRSNATLGLNEVNKFFVSFFVL